MLNIAICDDEAAAVRDVESKIKYYMQTHNVECALSNFLSGEALLSHLAGKVNSFDAVFLDIQMVHTSGIEVAKTIRQTDADTMIIFVTALKEHVFDAFDVEALQYLLKPISSEKLCAVLKKIVAATHPRQEDFITLHRGGEMSKIAMADILYCEAVNHRVFIYEKAKTSEYGSKIDDLEKVLSKHFFRCHRSFIVNLKYVDSYKNGVAFLPSGEKILIATRRRAAFMQALLRYQRNEVR